MKFLSYKNIAVYIYYLRCLLLQRRKVQPLPAVAVLMLYQRQCRFLNISPDSRSGAMGDAGVALSPDVNANYWNPAKLAFLENNDDVSLSYSPWLRHLVPDVSLAYLSYAHKIDDRQYFRCIVTLF
jgi:hypothetical protein